MVAVAPLLSERLGDFWGSMIFLPWWVYRTPAGEDAGV